MWAWYQEQMLNSSLSPCRLAVWSWVDQGAISGKVSPSPYPPVGPGTSLLFPLPTWSHQSSPRLPPHPFQFLFFSLQTHTSYSVTLHALPFPEPDL